MRLKRLSIIFILLLIGIFMFFYYRTDANHEKPDSAKQRVPLKVTHIGTILPDIIGITIEERRVEYGRQILYEPHKKDRFIEEGGNIWVVRNQKPIGSLVGRTERYIMTFDGVVGDRLEVANGDKPGSYIISSHDDNDFNNGSEPYAVYRKTKPSDLARIGMTFDAPLTHTIYLKLLRPMKTGKRYKIDFRLLDIPQQTFVYEPKKIRSEAIHVSHIGFRPDDPVKVAFLSLWMGSGGPLEFKEKTPFYVIDEKNEEIVFQGEVRLSKKLTEKDEDAYGNNFNGTNVYIMDFSSLKRPGKYRIYVEGVGCSYAFDIGDDVWSKAFFVSARGIFHQRSGIELGPPYTDFRRPRNFHPQDGVRIYASKTSLWDVEYGLKKGEDRFKKLVQGKTAEIVPDAWGGYCDAGDWDRRIQHLYVARALFDLFDIAPNLFKEFDLKIPGTKEDFPDILREALWGVDFFRRLQTNEGGVRGGIESEGHPRYGEASWQESQMVFAYAPDVYSTYLYAGSAAYAAYILKKYNMKNHEVYLDSAIKAMQWAEKEMGTIGRTPYQINDVRNLAASELFRLTGDKIWHDIFMETTALKGKEVLLFKHEHYDQAEAAWVYLNTDKKGVDNKIKQRCREAVLNEAKILMDAQKKTAFKWTQNPWRPAIAGTFTTPDCKNLIRAHIITGKKEYLESIILAAQTGAGANPLNISYTTGVGHNSPKHVMHVDSRITNQPPPPGITVFGPLNLDAFGEAESYFAKNIGKFCYPDFKLWPAIENYLDVFWYPAMCEYTIQNSIAPNAFTWGYLAIRK
ncbi:MAG TPA: glycoside hydrolase family 9 protein [Syntrophorhabdaceae bacterium]|nr:glycoside hydrolase family 9 protein [Syntrophorhabdaceae bacterium]